MAGAPGKPRGRSRLALAAVLVAALAAALGCHGKKAQQPKVIVIGLDGLDFTLTGQLMAEGKLPNLSKIAQRGFFQALGTAVPPQSPVAWSNFITGMDAGGHGIYDFIHRDAKTMVPYLSTSRVDETTRFFRIGKYQFPLNGGKTRLLRQGTPFWEVLAQHGIDTAVVRMPANFPPSGKADKEISGMGTPDLLGTPGTFQFYTTELFKYYGKEITGGEVHEVVVENDQVQDKIYGPTNPYLAPIEGQKPERLAEPFTVYLDPHRDAVKLVLADQERLLEKGEWSDWLTIDFKLAPTQHLTGIARFYLKQVRPELELYVTPINLDPLAPAQPISHPEDFAAELAERTGRYYTKEMPEDTKALNAGIFTPEEFLHQAELATEPQIVQLQQMLDDYRQGLLFFYFGDTDQVAHMMWRAMDPAHPAYNAAQDGPFAEVIPKLYQKFDRVLGYVLEHAPPDALVLVMSDHGFAPFRRAVNLNSWLRDNGYLATLDPTRRATSGFFDNFNWAKTKAYALGLNGLYINLAGREKDGIVPASEREALMKELSAKLLALTDTKNGERAITKVYPREEVYQDRGHLEIGPDLVVGFARTWRTSNESALAGLAAEVFSDNTAAWSGDHCMDHETVPGVLFGTRKLARPAASLKDLAASILVELGVQEPFPPRAPSAP